MLVNTQYFTEVARLGHPNLHPNSSDYRDYWNREKDRILNGYSVGGTYITGNHYCYLNYCKIEHKDKRGDARNNFPNFTDVDYEYYHAVEKARIEQKYLIVLKARQKGFSFKNAQIAAREFSFYRNSETLILAYLDEYADDLFDKCVKYLNDWIDTPFGKERNPDRQDYIKARFQEKLKDGSKKWKGYMSEIIKLTFHNNTAITRGKAPSLVIIEEAGYAQNLIEVRNKLDPAISIGDKLTSQCIIFGTGGDMDKGGSEGLMELFYQPEKYNCLTFDNNWEEDTNKKIGYFVPAYKYLLPFVDENGNSDITNAKKSLEVKRERLRQGSDSSAFYQEITENPFNPKEAFLIKTGNKFNTALLNDQIYNVTISGKGLIQKGNLEFVDENNRITTSITNKVLFILSDDGDFQILERPFFKNSTIPDSLYVSGCDSYDSESGKSLGSIFVYKRIFDANQTSNIFVAECTCRPKLAEDFYLKTLKLNIYYNSQMLFEHSNLGILHWYRSKNQLKFLKTRPRVAYQNIATSSKYTYGLQMNEQTKNYCESVYKTYVEEYSKNIFFLDLLNDNVKYTSDTNHDRTIAAMLCIVHNLDVYYKKTNEEIVQKPIMDYHYKMVNGVMVMVKGLDNNYRRVKELEKKNREAIYNKQLKIKEEEEYVS